MPTTYKRLTNSGVTAPFGTQGVIPGHRTNLFLRPANQGGNAYPWGPGMVNWNAQATAFVNTPSITGLSVRSTLTSSGDTNTFNCGVTMTAGTYTVSAYVYAPAGSSIIGRQMAVYPEMANATYGTISTNFPTIVADTWQRVSHTFTLNPTSIAPGGTTQNVWMTFRYTGAAITNSSLVYLDAPMLEPGETLGEYFDDQTPGAYVEGVRVIMPTNIRRNYVYNPSFEDSLQGWTGTNISRILKLTDNSNTDRKSLWCARVIFPSSTGSAYHTIQTDIGGSGAYFIQQLMHGLQGKTVKFSADVRTVTASTGQNRVGLQLVWFDGNGNYISESPTAAPPATSTTFSRIWEQATIPLNAVGVNLRFFRDGSATMNQAEYWIDNVMIEESSTYNDTYFDGSVPGGRWTGAKNFSPSTYNPSEATSVNLHRNPGFQVKPADANDYQVVTSLNTAGYLPLFNRQTIGITGQAGSIPANELFAILGVTELPKVANGTDVYTLSYYLYTGATLSYRVTANMHGADSGYLRTNTSANQVCEIGKWTRLTHTIRPVEGTKFIFLFWSSDQNNFAAGFQVNVGRPMCNAGFEAQEWFDGNDTNCNWVGVTADSWSFMNPPASSYGSMSSVYTVPSGNQAVVSTITVANVGSTPGSFRIAVVPPTETLSNKHYIVFDELIDKGETKAITEGITLGSSDQIQVQAANSPVAVNVFGTEIS